MYRGVISVVISAYRLQLHRSKPTYKSADHFIPFEAERRAVLHKRNAAYSYTELLSDPALRSDTPTLEPGKPASRDRLHRESQILTLQTIPLFLKLSYVHVLRGTGEKLQTR